MTQHYLLPDTPVLLRLLAESNEAVYEQLFRAHYAELCRYSFKFVRDKETAEELVQDLFVHLWENRQTLQVQTTFKSYLYTATRNRTLNFLKSKFTKLQNVEDVSLEPEAYTSADGNYELQELQNILDEGIAQLPERCRIIFLLSRQGGLTYNEIAEALELSVKTVENQMGTALKKLRTHLQLHWDKALPMWLILLIHG